MKLYGKNPVLERLSVNPRSIKVIYLNEKNDTAAVGEIARRYGTRCISLGEKEFFARSEGCNTQGVIADIAEFSYAELEDFLELSDAQKPVFIALSNITDPQNLGSILRSAACFGDFALILPKHRSASINETVLRVACGGENYVPVVQETNLVAALQRLKKAGCWIAGSVVEQGEDVTGFSFPFPLCVVIGAEDKGIRQGLLAHLDFKVTLPMPGRALSLNAAVAAAVLCYEIIRQKNAKDKVAK
ncbi:MAG: 23S rRNA (guanosine(2251)-2'-O)-methyltransferase RlmB [Candidatus Omnitrophica bacterium]|nr:23S rRNA (guanosine(2251)-2'-O)-methyltransferase RlmB [Candidatus Omnitrophota bacterium]MBU4479437.1 23S rRNA (guanosine(2251)-2'-O)-methyltransferase RlmB [Candidatus Omnitrophota bacterium]MCG2703172.1 23S rRNA (guanosine(2251)-2'-O)-methyltransferase RlmB [Candidatus Omnitrophota bacterium]